MTKKELAKALAEKSIFNSKAEAERKLDAIIDEIVASLQTEKSINLIGFGKWEVVDRAARVGRNPKTGQEIKIAAKKSIKFRPGRKLVDCMN